jgi:hypothetical protein
MRKIFALSLLCLVAHGCTGKIYPSDDASPKASVAGSKLKATRNGLDDTTVNGTAITPTSVTATGTVQGATVTSTGDVNVSATGLLKWGGTSSFPALKRSTTSVKVRLADDSADAPLTCSVLTASSTVSTTAITVTSTGAANIIASGGIMQFTDGLSAGSASDSFLFAPLNNRTGPIMEVRNNGGTLFKVDATSGPVVTAGDVSFQGSPESIVIGAGTVDFPVGQVVTTVGASGAASPLPALPVKYVYILIGGSPYVIPVYNGP